MFVVLLSAAGDVTLPPNILEAIKYQSEATHICWRKVNEVINAEAKQAFNIRYSGKCFIIPVESDTFAAGCIVQP